MNLWRAAARVMARECELEQQQALDQAPAQPLPGDTVPALDWFSSLPPGRVLRKLWSNSA